MNYDFDAMLRGAKNPGPVRPIKRSGASHPQGSAERRDLFGSPRPKPLDTRRLPQPQVFTGAPKGPPSPSPSLQPEDSTLRKVSSFFFDKFGEEINKTQEQINNIASRLEDFESNIVQVLEKLAKYQSRLTEMQNRLEPQPLEPVEHQPLEQANFGQFEDYMHLVSGEGSQA